MRYFLNAFGIPWGAASATAPPPKMHVPQWADRRAVPDLFDFFAALIVRFARIVLK